MNILITGVHGFVGSNLVKYLAKGNTIYGLDIVQPQKEGVKCTFSWEVLDIEGVMPEIDAIIHLAGKAHDTRNKSAADVYFKVNTGVRASRSFKGFNEFHSSSFDKLRN